MLKLTVIGKDVSQSLSPRMHTFIIRRLGGDCTYDAVSIPPAEFPGRAAELFSRYDGINVTIPFKADMVPFLSELRGDAASFGVVNVVTTKDKAGYNTDGYGFLMMLENAGVSVKGRTALVLGAGGAGRSCIKKLTDAGATVSAFERDEARLAAVYREFGGFTPLTSVACKPYDLIFNCTGIGMHDTVGQTPSVRREDGSVSPVGEELLAQCGTAVDLIYVPAESEFLRLARALGKRTVNGDAMLFYQAYMGDCIFLGRTPSSAQAKKLWDEYREEAQ